MAAATMTSAVLVLAIASLPTLVAAQAPAAPGFSTVTIRPSVSRDSRGSYTAHEDGSVVIYNMTLPAMIAEAYAIDENVARFTLVGTDDPLLARRFNVEAKGPAAAARDQQRLMLRALLADRFGVRTRTEQRELPVYVVARLRDASFGPRLRPSKVSCDAYKAVARAADVDVLAISPRDENGRPLCPPLFVSAGSSITLRGAGPIAELMDQLQPWVDRLLVDRTALEGLFTWSLTFTSDPAQKTQASPVSLPASVEEQLGLTFEAASAPIAVRVIDAADLPRLK